MVLVVLLVVKVIGEGSTRLDSWIASGDCRVFLSWSGVCGQARVCACFDWVGEDRGWTCFAVVVGAGGGTRQGLLERHIGVAGGMCDLHACVKVGMVVWADGRSVEGYAALVCFFRCYSVRVGLRRRIRSVCDGGGGGVCARQRRGVDDVAVASVQSVERIGARPSRWPPMAYRGG